MGEFNTKIVAEFTPPKTWVLEKALSFQTDQLNDEDIELIVRLLHEECDCHVYQKDFGETCPVWHARYDHMQDLIMELTK